MSGLVRSVVLLGAGAGLALAAPAPRAVGPAAGVGGVIATVGPTRILRSEFDAQVDQAIAEYRRRSGSELPEAMRPVVRRELLERLIQRNLLVLESKRLGLAPTEAEADQAMRQDPFFQEGGRFNQAKYEALRNSNPQMYRNALAQARERLAARRLSQRVETQSRPDEQTLRRRAARRLARLSFDYLALRRSDFAGTAPEPREAEVLAYYREHAEEFRRPAHATLTLLNTYQNVSDSLAHAPGGLAAWEKGLRERADSTLRAVRDGVSLEDAARAFDGVRPARVVENRFPRAWRGDAHHAALVYAAHPGEILPELVPSSPGWLIVRVDEAEPAHVARLAEAAPEIRARLRDRYRSTVERDQFAALYRTYRDSLRGPAWKVRYAAIDTIAFDPGEPTAQELDRYYRGHLADYSSFDAARGAIASKPFAEVRDDVRERWRRERSLQLTHALAERIVDTWSRGRRDAALERSAAVVEVGPVPLGVPLDSSAAGRTMADSLQNRQGALGVGVGPYPRGTLVFQVVQRVDDYVPTFEQAIPRLRGVHERVTSAEEEAGARRLFDRDPMQFKLGNVIHWARLEVQPTPIMAVTMTRAEVEQYLHSHLDRYTAPELVHISHILVSPRDSTGRVLDNAAEATPAADRAARARADSLLARVRAGEDFAALARAASDDEATRAEGGDLGEFGRGAMLEDFERVAFSMRAGDLRGPVHTSAGYHILKCHQYLPAFVQPLAQIYSNVSADLAKDKADNSAARRVDSLLRVIRTPAQARAAALRLRLGISVFTRSAGEHTTSNREIEAFMSRLDRLKPGEIYPVAVGLKNGGSSIAWVDSITAPAEPSWEQARAAAIERYRAGAGQRALDAKRAEIDSMLASGWTVDSLAALWGGLEHMSKFTAGTTVPGLGVRDLDSLIEAPGTARLRPGVMSGWVEFPYGLARIRIAETEAPNPEQLSARIETERRTETERNLRTYYDSLKIRYPVRILDPELRAVALPEPPAATP